MLLLWIELSYVTTIKIGASNWQKSRSTYFWRFSLLSRSMLIAAKRGFVMPMSRSLRDVDATAQDEIMLGNLTAWSAMASIALTVGLLQCSD